MEVVVIRRIQARGNHRRAGAAGLGSIAITAAILGGCGGPEVTVPLYDNLGELHHEISTSIPEAQQYFDQGLRLVYGFNHAEAIRSFEQAIEFDPDCAMCYWGVALALGPNINAAMDSAAGVVAYGSAQRGLELMASRRART